MLLFELFDSGSYTVITNSDELFVTRKILSDGTEFELECQQYRGVWEIAFSVANSSQATGAGIEIEVFSVAMKSLKQFMEEKSPKMICFSSKGNTRTSLYRKFISRYCSDMKTLNYVTNGATEFFLYRDFIPLETTEMGKFKKFSFPFFDRVIGLEVDSSGTVTCDKAFLAFLGLKNNAITNAIEDTLGDASVYIEDILF